MALEERLWVQKYRPRKVCDIIIPERIKKTLQGFVDKQDIPNLILASNCPGSGKTTTAKALTEQLGYETLFINASMENGIDVLRSKIFNFAAAVSFNGKLKCVILDESDYLTPAIQSALRGFIEKFSRNVRFIFTCNYLNRLIEPLISRCTVIDYTVDKTNKDETNTLCRSMLIRLSNILDSEKVEYDPKALIQLIGKHYPDWRSVLNDCQRYSASGKIDSGIMVNFNQLVFAPLIRAMRGKNFKEVRKWIGENTSICTDDAKIFNYFYKNAETLFTPQSIPALIVNTAEFQYKSAFVLNKEINVSAYLILIMRDCEMVKE